MVGPPRNATDLIGHSNPLDKLLIDRSTRHPKDFADVAGRRFDDVELDPGGRDH
jgi:hypothetical protein